MGHDGRQFVLGDQTDWAQKVAHHTSSEGHYTPGPPKKSDNISINLTNGT